MSEQLKGIIEWWKSEATGTARMLQAIPQEKMMEKLVEKTKTMAEIGAHLYHGLNDMAATFKAGKAVFGQSEEVPETVEQLVDNYNMAIEKLIEILETLPDEKLTAKYPLEMNGEVMWDPTGMEMVMGFIAHEIHHRAQIGVLIRIAGGKVPGMYGPSADEQ